VPTVTRFVRRRRNKRDTCGVVATLVNSEWVIASAVMNSAVARCRQADEVIDGTLHLCGGNTIPFAPASSQPTLLCGNRELRNESGKLSSRGQHSSSNSHGFLCAAKPYSHQAMSWVVPNLHSLCACECSTTAFLEETSLSENLTGQHGSQSDGLMPRCNPSAHVCSTSTSSLETSLIRHFGAQLDSHTAC